MDRRTLLCLVGKVSKALEKLREIAQLQLAVHPFRFPCPDHEKIVNWLLDYSVGLYEGPASVVTGIGNAFIFLGRGLGLMGSDEYLRWQAEALVVDAAVHVYATSSVVRTEATTRLGYAILLNTPPRDIGRLAARIVTGAALFPLGYAAAIGDGTRAVERTGRTATDALKCALSGCR